MNGHTCTSHVSLLQISHYNYMTNIHNINVMYMHTMSSNLSKSKTMLYVEVGSDGSIVLQHVFALSRKEAL